jgi:hypothetical protein
LDLIQETKRDLEARRTPDSPAAWELCRNWTQAWLYIMKRVDLHAAQHLMFEEEEVVRAVLIGADFDSRIIGLLEKLNDKLGVDNQLRELRLIDTEFCERHIQFLRSLFPAARITVVTDEEWQADLDLSTASYDMRSRE